MALNNSEVLSEKINFEIYNGINLGEGLNHSAQIHFINNDYSGADLYAILKLRKDLIYGYVQKKIEDVNFFTIQSENAFQGMLNPDALFWNKSIIYSPLNNHSRDSLKKGDILFCNRIGQFSNLNMALDTRGIYAVGIAIEDPKIYYPAKHNHEKYGVKVIFPFSLKKNLSTRNIQLNPVTIAQTPYNGNRNDSLQKIDSLEIAKELLDMIAKENPDFKNFLRIFYSYSSPNVLLFDDVSKNSIDILEEFIKWFDEPENNLKSYQGLFDYDLLRSWDTLFFGGRLFKIRFNDIEGSIQDIEEIVKLSKTDERWTGFSVACNKGAPAAVIGEKNYLRFLKTYDFTKTVHNPLRNNYNKVIYGAPGTGKSHRIASYLEDNHIREDYIELVVFHPDKDYHSFVGGYKPITSNNGDDSQIRYEYVPQSFLNMLLKAHRDPNHNYYLIIEEINRGNCAEIFGDMFQLLDRKPKYKITPSTELRRFIDVKEKEDNFKYLIDGKLSMPQNLILYATMNTSDQSLYPMDSAFKRRWEWEYEPIVYPKEGENLSNKSFTYLIRIEDGLEFQWVHFMKIVNDIILGIPGLGMDKCLGNFFIEPEQGTIIDGEAFINKVIFYLWNDVLKEEVNTFFANKTFHDFVPYHTKGILRLKEFISTYGIEYKYSDPD